MKKLHVHFTRGGSADQFVGQLVQHEGRVYFEYDPDFLGAGLNLSPFRLPFQRGVYTHSDFQFGPLPAEIIEQAQAAISRWPQWADQAGVTRRRAKEIAATFPKLR